MGAYQFAWLAIETIYGIPISDHLVLSSLPQ